jgi:hypothetical protein
VQKWLTELPSPSLSSPFRIHTTWAIDTVNLGLKHDVPRVLRKAFYELVGAMDFHQIENDVPQDIVDERSNPRAGAKLSVKNVYKLMSLRESLRSQ